MLDKLSTNLANNLDFVYYSNPVESSNLLVKYCKFKDIEHLTSYILYSNEIPYSQLVFSLGLNFKKFKQFDIIFHQLSNTQLEPELTVTNICNIHAYNNNELSILYSKEFWIELLYLYLINFHPFNSIFNLKQFNPAKMNSTLLVAIYFKGYQYYSKKSKKLTDYMTQLALSLLKRILFKPSLTNLQAIYLLIYSLNINNETEVGRAYLSQLTRMSYLLGLNINTNKFSSGRGYDRKLVFIGISSVNRNASGSISIYPNYIAELPDIDPVLYKSEWQLLSLSLNFQQPYDHLYYSRLTSINSKFKLLTLIQVTFPSKNSFSTPKKLEKFCQNRLLELNKVYVDICRDFDLLKLEFNDKMKDICSEELITKRAYLLLCLDVIEYWKLNSTALSQSLISCLIKLSCELIEKSLELGNFGSANISSLLAFNLLSIYNFIADKDEKNIAMDNLEILSNGIGICDMGGKGDMASFSNKLLIQTGLKLIKI